MNSQRYAQRYGNKQSPVDINVKEMFQRPKQASPLIKSQRLIELQEKKMNEQRKQLKDITEKYLMLDITLTKELREKKLLQAENEKLKAQILELSSGLIPTSGAGSGSAVAASLDEISKLSNKIQAEGEAAPPLPQAGGQFVKSFTEPLRIQIAQGGAVNDVDPSGAASKNGVRSGDTIVSIDGVPLRLLYAHTKDPTSREISAFINQARKTEGQVRVCFLR